MISGWFVGSLATSGSARYCTNTAQTVTRCCWVARRLLSLECVCWLVHNLNENCHGTARLLLLHDDFRRTCCGRDLIWRNGWDPASVFSVSKKNGTPPYRFPTLSASCSNRKLGLTRPKIRLRPRLAPGLMADHVFRSLRPTKNCASTRSAMISFAEKPVPP